MAEKEIESKTNQNCPICDKSFPQREIEKHVNKCIFLNSVDQRDEKQNRKRPPSPLLLSRTQKSPKTTKLSQSPSQKPKHPRTSNTFPCKTHSSQPSSSKTTNGDETEEMSLEESSTKKSSAPKMLKPSDFVPLAKRLQPTSLNDFHGQNQVLGRNTILRNLLENGEIPNMILWGPPGCGKTSLSNVINEMCKGDPKKYKFISLCATSCGVKEVESIAKIATNEQKFGRKTILFMDEIHRFNKKQQDSFLSYVEKGIITLIGATTENPSFILNSALLSRCRVIVMEKLVVEDLYSILEHAASVLDMNIIDDDDPSFGSTDDCVSIKRDALQWLADMSDGDARIALGNLELVVQHFKNSSTKKIIETEDIKDGIKKSHMLYDRKGEEHYNIISAMHKSIRGSDDNAALYWTTRMIVSGEDPRFIARRLVRAASEDIGNADPAALPLAVATMQGCQLLGMPEADVLLAQCAIYLARAPKSREADSALAAAKHVISQCKGTQPAVPMHIRNAPTKLMKELGYGRLAPGATRSFMPPGLEDLDFFKDE